MTTTSSAKDIAEKIAKSSRFKKAVLSEEATPVDLTSIFVDYALAVFDATRNACVKAYGDNRFTNSTDIKKFIREVSFPSTVTFAIR